VPNPAPGAPLTKLLLIVFASSVCGTVKSAVAYYLSPKLPSGPAAAAASISAGAIRTSGGEQAVAALSCTALT
jgi:hypothetical protein